MVTFSGRETAFAVMLKTSWFVTEKLCAIYIDNSKTGLFGIADAACAEHFDNKHRNSARGFVVRYFLIVAAYSTRLTHTYRLPNDSNKMAALMKQNT